MNRYARAWLALVAVVCVACLAVIVNARLDADRVFNGPTAPNGSTDGRYHTCGYVTEDGVTEQLAAYSARCGR